MGNTMGDCGCADAKDAVKPGPAPLPKQQDHVDAPSTTKVEGDAVALGGPDKSIAVLLKEIEEMKENHRERPSGVLSESKQEKPKNEGKGSSLSQGSG
ncbi:hypothetical protein ACFX2J_019886 [Malus domestica]